MDENLSKMAGTNLHPYLDMENHSFS